MTTHDAAGWWAYPLNARKAHYFVEARALCGRWMFFGEQPDQPQHMGDEPGADDCTTCWAKAKKLTSTLVLPSPDPAPPLEKEPSND